MTIYKREGNVINIEPSIIKARHAEKKLEEAISREGLTEFHLNQISVALFKGEHWRMLSTDNKNRLIDLINKKAFDFEKPAPDYPDEPA